MEDLKDLIASVVAYLAKRQREEEASQFGEYAYAPVRVRVQADEREVSDGSVSWRM